jgi:predicted oxidoreductase
MRHTLLALLLLAGCAQPGPGNAAEPGASLPRWHAVLVAGDASLEVWDRAVEHMATGLRNGGRLASIRRFSARRERLAAGAEPAIRAPVLEAIAGLRPAPGEACLIFLTMHGAPGRASPSPPSLAFSPPPSSMPRSARAAARRRVL